MILKKKVPQSSMQVRSLILKRREKQKQEVASKKFEIFKEPKLKIHKKMVKRIMTHSTERERNFS